MKHRSASQSPIPASARLSPSGQMIGWVVFGGLVVGGFVFGVVVGYETPLRVLVVKAENPSTKQAEVLDPKKDDRPPGRPELAPVKVVPPSVDAPKPDQLKKDLPGTEPKRIEPKPKPPLPKKVEPKSKAPVPVSFRKEVLPILRAHCLNCHGGGTGKPKGDVNLTTIANMRRSAGQILVPGKPDESDVYTSITQRDMPDGGRPKPTERELLTLRNWILTGARERRRLRTMDG